MVSVAMVSGDLPQGGRSLWRCLLWRSSLWRSLLWLCLLRRSLLCRSLLTLTLTVSKAGVKLLGLLGYNCKRVVPNIGLEQARVTYYLTHLLTY